MHNSGSIFIKAGPGRVVKRRIFRAANKFRELDIVNPMKKSETGSLCKQTGCAQAHAPWRIHLQPNRWISFAQVSE